MTTIPPVRRWRDARISIAAGRSLRCQPEETCTTNAETVLTQTAADDYPAISRDGQRVAYSSRLHGKLPVFVVAASGGAPEQVCDDCGEVEAWIAGRSRNPVRVRRQSGRCGPSHYWLVAESRVAATSSLWDLQPARVERRAMGVVQRSRQSAGPRPVCSWRRWMNREWRLRRTGSSSRKRARRPRGRRRPIFCISGPSATARRVCGRSDSTRRRNDRWADRSPFSTFTAGDSRGGISTLARRTSRSPATRSF